jgi:hypothetical protein
MSIAGPASKLDPGSTLRAMNVRVPALVLSFCLALHTPVIPKSTILLSFLLCLRITHFQEILYFIHFNRF